MTDIYNIYEGLLKGQDATMSAGDEFQKEIDLDLFSFQEALSKKQNLVEVEKNHIYKFTTFAPGLCKHFDINSKDNRLSLRITNVIEDDPNNSYWKIQLWGVNSNNVFYTIAERFITHYASKAKTINAVLKKVITPIFKDLKSIENEMLKYRRDK